MSDVISTVQPAEEFALTPAAADGAAFDAVFREHYPRVVGLLEGQCRSNAFASYLEVSVQRGPDSPASLDIQGDLAEPLGLHLVDMEVAMGILIDLVGQQARSYLDSTEAPRLTPGEVSRREHAATATAGTRR